MRRKFFHFVCFVFLLMFFCCVQPENLSTLDRFFEEYNQDYAHQDSLLASGWKSFSEDSLEVEQQKLKKWLDLLSEIDPNSLDLDDRINFDLARYVINNDLYLIENRIIENPLNSEGGFLTELYYELQGITIDSEEKNLKYLQKLNAFPGLLEEHIELMKAGLQSGRTAPKLIVQNCINVLEPQLTTDIEKSIYYQPVDTSKDSDIQDACLEVIREKIKPALQEYHKFLVLEYLPGASEEIGVSSWPDGKTYYEQRIRYYTTLDVSPDEVFAIGQSEVQRIRNKMEMIIEALEYKGSFSEFLQFLRTDPQFYAKSPEDLLEKASRISKRMEEQMPVLFGQLPRMPFTVTPVPDALAPNYTGGRYSPGSYKHNRAGQYWVNTYKLETRPLYVLPALTLHEAVPGHHHQIMLALEIEDVPPLRRDLYLSAFGEGWGLYSEFLGIEANIYQNPYENFGRLTYEMWRACRLVVDVGIHYKGWIRDQAIEFMASNTALSIHEVNTEIDRYIGWPGQAVSYKMGEIKIKELRAKAEEKLGDRFDIRTFHDEVLKNGSILMSSLEQVIDGYISAN